MGFTLNRTPFRPSGVRPARTAPPQLSRPGASRGCNTPHFLGAPVRWIRPFEGDEFHGTDKTIL